MPGASMTPEAIASSSRATWDNGARLLNDLRDRGHGDMADALSSEHGQLLAEIKRSRS